jgi:two-component system cell cycle response regulator/two-component system cell cycle response regulator DivK
MTKVMLVEDNNMNARLLEHVLIRDGFELVIFSSAEEAIAAAVSEMPDIILMDIQLPGMDGLDAARQLKNESATSMIPIVAITAHAMNGDEDRILQSGCEGYISKPINTRDVTAKLKSFLEA